MRVSGTAKLLNVCAWYSLLLPLSSAHANTAFTASEEPLNTIIITARRLEESAQDVPISVTSISGEKLSQAGITTAQELQQVVAGLQVAVPNPRLAQFTLRGLGSSSFNEGLESSVGLFVDGVYLGRQSMSITDLIDIERIEVARGPQGTLFGKNATAGTIHVITQKPQFTRGTGRGQLGQRRHDSTSRNHHRTCQQHNGLTPHGMA